MSMDRLDSTASVVIAGDRLSATLRLLPDADQACCTSEILLALVSSKGISRSSIDTDELEALAAEHRIDNSIEHARVIARGEPPRHGSPGRFELEPSLAEEIARTEDSTPQPGPARSIARPGEDGGPDQVSFYEQSRYVVVRPGQVLGHVRPPVEGVDGVDVTGASLAARQGVPFALSSDPSIDLRPDGTVIALLEGRLDQTPAGVRVVRELIIDESVDFSTGNIDFPGDAVVRRGIKDCFKVAVGGNLRVQELVEAASIECGGDCTLDRGMSARGKGELRVGASLRATFLSDARVDVARDLLVTGEVRSCNIRVGRAIRSPRAAILGGVTYATIEVELAQLGGEGEMPTELLIGHAPALQELAQRIGELLPKIRARAQQAQVQYDALAAAAPRPNAQQKEQLLELQYIASNASSKIPQLERAIDELAQTASRHIAAPSATIQRMIYPKCVIVIGPWRIDVVQAIKGPLKIIGGLGEQPRLVSPTTGSIRPWGALARVLSDERFAALPPAFWSKPREGRDAPAAA